MRFMPTAVLTLIGFAAAPRVRPWADSGSILYLQATR
jgi:hypothetical protein